VLAGNNDGPYHGTEYAVYDFLRSLGIRWYMPGEASITEEWLRPPKGCNRGRSCTLHDSLGKTARIVILAAKAREGEWAS